MASENERALDPHSYPQGGVQIIGLYNPKKKNEWINK